MLSVLLSKPWSPSKQVSEGAHLSTRTCGRRAPAVVGGFCTGTLRTAETMLAFRV